MAIEFSGTPRPAEAKVQVVPLRVHQRNYDRIAQADFRPVSRALILWD